MQRRISVFVPFAASYSPDLLSREGLAPRDPGPNSQAFTFPRLLFTAHVQSARVGKGDYDSLSQGRRRLGRPGEFRLEYTRPPKMTRKDDANFILRAATQPTKSEIAAYTSRFWITVSCTCLKRVVDADLLHTPGGSRHLLDF